MRSLGVYLESHFIRLPQSFSPSGFATIEKTCGLTPTLSTSGGHRMAVFLLNMGSEVVELAPTMRQSIK